MLDFYQGQQAIQGLLATFLDIYPYEYPNKETLVALTNLQNTA
ncbi:hypothetical protein [Legionella tunisiensis]|nr:hypothetical protein [Legionella tunisiensis]